MRSAELDTARATQCAQARFKAMDRARQLPMGADYSVRLVARNEGVEYRDAGGTYHFDVSREGKHWKILVPPSKGDSYTPHELTPEEQARILPRITEYLREIRWFGLFPSRYEVSVERTPAPLFSIEEYKTQLVQAGWVREVRPDGQVAFRPPPGGMVRRHFWLFALLALFAVAVAWCLR